MRTKSEGSLIRTIQVRETKRNIYVQMTNTFAVGLCANSVACK